MLGIALIALAVSISCTATADEPVALTTDGRWKQDPVFVRGGREIVYAEAATKPNLVLRKLDVETGKSERLHPEANLPEFKPTFAANETTYAWLMMTGNDNLFLTARLKPGDAPLHVKVGQMVAWHPSISPDGKRILYNGNAQIRSVTIPELKGEPFLESAGRNDWPAFSPDGTQVAFGSSRDGNFEIYVASVEDRANPRRLTNSPGMDMRPAWSPDGKRLAFTSRRDGNPEIYVMNVDRSAVVRVTNHPERDDYAAWHPDGRRIVTVSERDGRFDLLVHAVDRD